MFRRRTVLIPKTEMTVGEFDPSADGAYRNVKTLPLEVRPKRDLFVSVESNVPIDAAVSDSSGKCITFREKFTSGTISARPEEKGTAALMIGVFRGDLAKVTIEAWME
jgi:hypothetical protein